MDGNSFTRLRQSNKKLSVFIEASRSRLKVGILGNHQLHLTNNVSNLDFHFKVDKVIDIYRRKRIKMDFCETDASMRSTLIGLRPKVIYLVSVPSYCTFFSRENQSVQEYLNSSNTIAFKVPIFSSTILNLTLLFPP